MMPITELEVHQQAAEFIQAKWPRAIFWSDGSGNNLSPVQAAIASDLRSAKGVPDFHLLVPRGPYHGAFWELKRPDSSPYLKDGKLSTAEHVQDQAEMLQALMYAGYYAQFAVGIEDFMKQATWYMTQQK